MTGKCKDPNCLRYSGDVCSECRPFYSILNNNLPCFFSDPNCAQLGNNKCNICNDRFYLHPQGYCQVKPNFCQDVIPETGACRICQANY